MNVHTVKQNTEIETIRSISEAVDFFEQQYRSHPERDLAAARRFVLAGERRPYPVLIIRHLYDPADTSEDPERWTWPEVLCDDAEEENLAREVVSMLRPLELNNPIEPSFGLGEGPGTLVTFFGIPLKKEADNGPAYTLTLDEALRRGTPDAERGGVMPAMLRRIEWILTNTPDWFSISLPNLQGPYNIVSALIGEEALIAPYTEPENFYELMDRVTDLFLQVKNRVTEAIGTTRLDPWCKYRNLIANCSANLVSSEFYVEHILPYDRRIADHAGGEAAMHPCSGPHVFETTLKHLPLNYTEAGYVERTAAGAICPAEALAQIDGRPIILWIGQELPPGGEYAFITKDLDRYADHPRLLFEYTAMHWRKKDRHLVRKLHDNVDEYWRRMYG